jgi:hypothetical protein
MARVLPLPDIDVEPTRADPVLLMITWLAKSAIEEESRFASDQVTVKVTGPLFVKELEGALIATVGATLSTVNVVLGPAAGAAFAARSEAVLAGREIPTVPSPVSPPNCMVRVLPLPEIKTEPTRAEPVLLIITWLASSEMDEESRFASAHVTVKVTGPVLMKELEGALIATVGAVLSTEKVVLGPAAGAGLAARSEAVLAGREIPTVPSPVIPSNCTVRVLPLPEIETEPTKADRSDEIMGWKDRLERFK